MSGLGHYDGTITFDGRSTRRRSVEALARSGLVHVPEGRRIFAPLTVVENLDVARAAAGRRSDAWAVDDVFDLFPPLVPLRDRRGWMLSGGEQQMLAIGRALLGAPRLLLLDEPSLGLAPRFVRSVFEALVRISATVPMLLVEQNTAVALDVATRGYVISSGRIVVEGSAGELAEHASVLDRYLGRTDATDA